MRVDAETPDAFFDDDVSVSDPGIGSLFDPWGDHPIGHGHARIAAARGVARALVTPHGTTMANKIAIWTLVGEGSKVLVERDTHVSILGALIERGAEPVWLMPTFDDELGVYLPSDATAISDALAADPAIEAVVVTSPKYFGLGAKVSEVVAAVHASGRPLLVDGAHGACAAFHEALPECAASAGAEIVTQSTHKTTSAFSPGSTILLNDVSLEHRVLHVLHSTIACSTSFSVPVLQSVFEAEARLALDGDEIISRRIDTAEALRARLGSVPGLACWPARVPSPQVGGIDPTRVVLDVGGSRRTGWDVESELVTEFGIVPEMASLRHVLFLVQSEHGREQVQATVDAVRTVAARRAGVVRGFMHELPRELPAQAMSPRRAFEQAWAGRFRRTPVADAVGKICGETISVYPPGSAQVVSGEVLDEQTAAFLRAAHVCGAHLKGATDPAFETTVTIETEDDS